MSGPVDIDVLHEFYVDVEALDFGGDSTSSEEDAQIQKACLWMTGALLLGGWCDFSIDGPFPNDGYQVVRSFLESLPCYPLLKPWLEQRRWTADEVTALKVELEMVKA